MRLYGSFQKVDAEQRMVSGYASTEAVDASGEVILKSAIEAALADYLEFANIREMHQLSAVGTAEEATVDDKGLYLTAKVVDDTAWGKVTSGVYKGFSIGGKVLARDAKNKKIITKIALHEISLVDRPQNPEARFDVWKAAGTEESQMAKAKVKDEPATAVEPEAEIAKTIEAEAVIASAPETEDVAEKAAKPEAAAEAEAEVDPIAKASAAVDALTAAVAAVAPAPVTELAKSMYDVRAFADVITSVAYLVRASEDEANWEGDNSKVPAKLRSWLTAGAAIFKEMAVEEIDELIAPVKVKKAAEAEDLAKAATEAASALVDATAADALAKATGERDDLAKALGVITERIDPLIKTVEALGKRLLDVEATPMPPKTAGPGATVIAKGVDAAGGASEPVKTIAAEDDLVKALAAMSNEDKALLLIKASRQLPMAVNYRGA